MYKSVFLPKAYLEFFDAWEWYEHIQKGLGNRFRDQVFKTVSNITDSPFLYSIRKEPYREAAIDVFPYLIVYQVFEQNNKIAIVSVFHSSRNPVLKH